MSLLDRFLLRFGLVRLKRYGLSVGPDGRLVSAPQVADHQWSDSYLPPAPALDLLQPSSSVRRIARGSAPPPIPGQHTKEGIQSAAEADRPRGDLTTISVAPLQPPLPQVVQAPAPIAAAEFAPTPAAAEPLAVRPDATDPEQRDEEAEWRAAMERAKAQADDCGQGEDESDEEWEWRMAMARAKADKTDEVERPARLADGSGPTPRMNKSELAAKPKSQSAYEMAKKLRPRQQRSGMTYLDKKRSMERKRKTLGQGPDTLVDNKPPGAGAEPRQGAPLPSIRKR